MIQHNPKPLPLIEAFEKADLEMGRNETARRLRDDWRGMATASLCKQLTNMGIKKLVNLTHAYQDARIALAFYAGNGIVVKIIPQDHLSDIEVIYHLPAIATKIIDTEARSFVIKTYPWLNNSITSEEIEKMRKSLFEVGLAFNDQDDHPGNIRRLPDKAGTIIGIDSKMYQGQSVSKNLQSAWHAYIHELFPVYDAPNIPQQTGQTNFEFISIHNPKSDLHHFDHKLENPIQRVKKPEQGFGFGKLFKSFTRDPALTPG